MTGNMQTIFLVSSGWMVNFCCEELHVSEHSEMVYHDGGGERHHIMIQCQQLEKCGIEMEC